MASARPIGIDLFSGAGGLSLGFEQAGFDVVAAVELDAVHSATHQFNFPECRTICRSVVELGGASIRSLAGLGGGKIDVVFGGAPCQGFSLIGHRALEDPRNHLVRHFARIVSELGASYFVFENVKGLTIGHHRRFLDEVIDLFQKSGYDVVQPYQVLNAANYGVPQDRRRLFLLGARKGLPLPAYPGQTQQVVVAEALGDVPDADEYPELLARDYVAVKWGRGSRYARRLRGQEVDPDDYSHPRIWDRALLTSSMRTEHTPKSIGRFKKTKPGSVEPISRFLRLDPDGVCNTLRAGTASDRGAYTSPRPIHPYLPRVLTVREAARLHSYPDWFRFHATKWHGFRQVGNSVPPLLGRAVARELARALGVRPTKPQRSIELGDPSLLELTMSEASVLLDAPADAIPKRRRIADSGTPAKDAKADRKEERANQAGL
ncbi:MAG TPA: DNA cytosine methyltransferase [Blastocatellia bacterium]|nr:DNA cytosine methyltransferase [Blastocatellia bacterium]